MGRAAVAGLLISGVLLWWALHDVHLAEVAGHLRAARFFPLLGCVVTATLVFPLRTIRWQYILQLDGVKLPFVPLWHATAIGFMANNLLPARAGEVARVYAATRLTAVPFMTVAATLVVERMMDGLTLVTILALAVFLTGFEMTTTVGPFTFGQILGGAALLLVVSLGAAVWAVHWPNPALKIGRKTLNTFLPERWVEKGIHAMEGVFDGFGVLREWKRLGLVTAWSFVIWGANGISFLLCMVAFDLPVPWTAAFVIQSLIAFGISVPSAPGFFGVFEAVTKATLILYGIAPDLAVSYAVGYHLFTFVPITVLGLWSLSRAHLHLADLRTAHPEKGILDK